MEYVSPGESEYKTRDLYEASALHAAGLPVRGVVREGETCYFTFEGVPECEKLSMAYRNREMQVDAKTLIESLKTMKDFIYSTTRRG